ncbi:hypothetical protein OAY10_02615 [Acidimicrobiaceae bacterium]|jgi:hypothetical protein|nr:hypothetical protein [Acidimicrobiaceae bacterium]|tara:strand:- start:1162 stop:2025 length:864 start_codon:yes stop_codon:yes gene_type:complete
MKNKLDNLFSLLNEDKFQKRLKKFNIFVAVISIVYIGVLFNSSKEEITNIAVINFFEIILLMIIYFIVGLTWVKFSTKNTQENKKNIFFDWAYSNIGKYFPGGVGLITIRLNQDGNQDKSKRILFGLFEEQFLVPILSLPVLLIGMLFLDKDYIYFGLVLLQFGVVYLFKFIYFFNKKIKEISILNFSNYLTVTILSTNFLTFFIFFNLGYENFLNQGIYYLIASYVGLLFVGIPAGIGIREAIFIFLLGTEDLISEEILSLIYIRMLYLIVDSIYGLTGFIHKTRK